MGKMIQDTEVKAVLGDFEWRVAAFAAEQESRGKNVSETDREFYLGKAAGAKAAIEFLSENTKQLISRKDCIEVGALKGFYKSVAESFQNTSAAWFSEAAKESDSAKRKFLDGKAHGIDGAIIDLMSVLNTRNLKIKL